MLTEVLGVGAGQSGAASEAVAAVRGEAVVVAVWATVKGAETVVVAEAVSVPVAVASEA